MASNVSLWNAGGFLSALCLSPLSQISYPHCCPWMQTCVPTSESAGVPTGLCAVGRNSLSCSFDHITEYLQPLPWASHWEQTYMHISVQPFTHPSTPSWILLQPTLLAPNGPPPPHVPPLTYCPSSPKSHPTSYPELCLFHSTCLSKSSLLLWCLSWPHKWKWCSFL